MLSNNVLAIIVLVVVSLMAVCIPCFFGISDAVLIGGGGQRLFEGFTTTPSAATTSTTQPVTSWGEEKPTTDASAEPVGGSVKEGFASYVHGVNEGAPINHTMGPWDSMEVPRSSNPDPESWWKFTPDIGPGAGVSEVLLYQDSVAAVSPMCCGAATYSTSSGCVCTTPAQRNLINARGGNRTGGNDV